MALYMVLHTFTRYRQIKVPSWMMWWGSWLVWVVLPSLLGRLLPRFSYSSWSDPIGQDFILPTTYLALKWVSSLSRYQSVLPKSIESDQVRLGWSLLFLSTATHKRAQQWHKAEKGAPILWQRPTARSMAIEMTKLSNETLATCRHLFNLIDVSPYFLQYQILYRHLTN